MRLVEHGGAAPKAPKLPLATVLREHRRAVPNGLGLTIGGTSAHFIIVFFLSIYGVKMLGLPRSAAMLSGLCIGLRIVRDSVCRRAGRRLSVGPHRPQPACVDDPHPADARDLAGLLPPEPVADQGALLALVTALSIVHSLNGGPTGAMRGDRLQLGVAIFGGFAQFFVTSLIVTKSVMAPAWYVIGCGALSVIAVAGMRERSKEALGRSSNLATRSAPDARARCITRRVRQTKAARTTFFTGSHTLTKARRNEDIHAQATFAKLVRRQR
jgi:hypothetical protein